MRLARAKKGGALRAPSFFVPNAVSAKSFGRPRALRVAKATKRVVHEPLRGCEVTRVRDLKAQGLRWRSSQATALHRHVNCGAPRPWILRQLATLTCAATGRKHCSVAGRL